MTGADRETDMTRNSPEGNVRRCFQTRERTETRPIIKSLLTHRTECIFILYLIEFRFVVSRHRNKVNENGSRLPFSY